MMIRGRTLTWVALGAIMLLVAAAATVGVREAPGPFGRAEPAPIPASAPGRHQVALGEAMALLAVVRVPNGAVRVSTTPVPATSSPPQVPGTPDLVDQSAFWTAPGTVAAVTAWERINVPVGATLAGQGALSTWGITNYRYVVFALSAKQPVLTSQMLVMTVAPDGANEVALRADAQVVWDPARTKESLLNPQLVKSITITAQDPIGRKVAMQLTDERRIRHMVAVLNHLPVDNSGPHSCPAIVGIRFEAVFTGQAQKTLAMVSGDQAECEGLSLVVADKAQPNVDDPGEAFLHMVASTINVPPSGG